MTSNISYHDGKAIYLSTKGVVSLLTRSIKTDEEVIREFSRVLKIDLSCNTTITKEEETIGAIVKALREIEPLKRQYRVGQYRIDLYFPRLKLAVECDEYDHRDRDADLERTREEYIKSALSCEFFRFNPDDKRFNVFVMLGRLLKTREEILKTTTIDYTLL